MQAIGKQQGSHLMSGISSHSTSATAVQQAGKQCWEIPWKEFPAATLNQQRNSQFFAIPGIFQHQCCSTEQTRQQQLMLIISTFAH